VSALIKTAENRAKNSKLKPDKNDMPVNGFFILLFDNKYFFRIQTLNHKNPLVGRREKPLKI